MTSDDGPTKGPPVRPGRFALEPVDDDFFDTASFRISETFEIPLPASQVWSELTGDRPLEWCRVLQRVTWTSPRPFGVGTTRTARALGIVIHERFFRWDEGRRQSFYGVAANLPAFRSLAEDYALEVTSQTSCRFTWVIAIEPRLPAWLANPANKALMGSLFRDTRKHYGLD